MMNLEPVDHRNAVYAAEANHVQLLGVTFPNKYLDWCPDPETGHSVQ